LNNNQQKPNIDQENSKQQNEQNNSYRTIADDQIDALRGFFFENEGRKPNVGSMDRGNQETLEFDLDGLSPETNKFFNKGSSPKKQVQFEDGLTSFSPPENENFGKFTKIDEDNFIEKLAAYGTSKTHSKATFEDFSYKNLENFEDISGIIHNSAHSIKQIILSSDYETFPSGNSNKHAPRQQPNIHQKEVTDFAHENPNYDTSGLSEINEYLQDSYKKPSIFGGPITFRKNELTTDQFGPQNLSPQHPEESFLNISNEDYPQNSQASLINFTKKQKDSIMMVPKVKYEKLKSGY
jgi:hypothetical protein